VRQTGRDYSKRSAGRSESGRDSPRVEFHEIVPKVDKDKNIYSQSDRYKYLLKYLPAEEKLRRYMKARNRIFAEHQLSGIRMFSRRVQKTRERFSIRRFRRREVVAAVKRVDSADPRPFAGVEILGMQLTGLLDTGASVCLLTKSVKSSWKRWVLPSNLGGPDGFCRGSIHYRTLGDACKIRRRK